MEVPGSTVASSSEEKLCSLSPSKSILRDRSQKAGLSRKRSIVWDEQNIMATESRRASGHNRIPDAKTPYVYYDPEKDKVLGIGKPCITPEELEAKLAMVQNELENSDLSSRIEEFSMSDESDDVSEEELEEKKRFSEQRAYHYNMKDAIALSRQLIKEEQTDTKEDEESS